MKRTCILFVVLVCLGVKSMMSSAEHSKDELLDLAGHTIDYLIKARNSKNQISDSLFIYLLDYCMFGYKCTEYSEGIYGVMYDVFYQDDLLGKRFDNYMSYKKISQNVQDTIRLRLMSFIDNEYFLRVTMARYQYFPYFRDHNAIRDPELLQYDEYFK